jgi:hypothetical protein
VSWPRTLSRLHILRMVANTRDASTQHHNLCPTTLKHMGELGELTVGFGKYEGNTWASVAARDASYCRWVIGRHAAGEWEGEPLSLDVLQFVARECDAAPLGHVPAQVPSAEDAEETARRALHSKIGVLVWNVRRAEGPKPREDDGTGPTPKDVTDAIVRAADASGADIVVLLESRTFVARAMGEAGWKWAGEDPDAHRGKSRSGCIHVFARGNVRCVLCRSLYGAAIVLADTGRRLALIAAIHFKHGSGAQPEALRARQVALISSIADADPVRELPFLVTGDTQMRGHEGGFVSLNRAPATGGLPPTKRRRRYEKSPSMWHDVFSQLGRPTTAMYTVDLRPETNPAWNKGVPITARYDRAYIRNATASDMSLSKGEIEPGKCVSDHLPMFVEVGLAAAPRTKEAAAKSVNEAVERVAQEMIDIAAQRA